MPLRCLLHAWYPEEVKATATTASKRQKTVQKAVIPCGDLQQIEAAIATHTQAPHGHHLLRNWRSVLQAKVARLWAAYGDDFWVGEVVQFAEGRFKVSYDDGAHEWICPEEVSQGIDDMKKVNT